jgi:hypothetical protein
LVALTDSARSAPPPTLESLIASLLDDDATTRQESLRAIERRGDRAAIPALIDVLVFDIFLDSSVVRALERLSGQRFGHDWRLWVEWLETQRSLRPHAGYVAWKSDLFSRIDPAFTQFIYPGVKHRVRVEEILWGGVRKDGIPALTNPRHVKPQAATYLTPDELVLGLSINGDSRAYPLRIMDWHEMANDVVGGTALALAY